MISEKQILRIIEECKSSGYDVRIRDIAYVVLTKTFSDKNIAYKSVFGVDCIDIQQYDSSPHISYLRTYIEYNIDNKRVKEGTKRSVGISFEENRAEMEKLLKQTQDAMDEGLMEAKDGLKIMADIRVKLNDKFNVNEDVRDQIVVIEPKFNSQCSFCGHEIYIPTKEDLMAKYGLVESEN